MNGISLSAKDCELNAEVNLLSFATQIIKLTST